MFHLFFHFFRFIFSQESKHFAPNFQISSREIHTKFDNSVPTKRESTSRQKQERLIILPARTVVLPCDFRTDKACITDGSMKKKNIEDYNSIKDDIGTIDENSNNVDSIDIETRISTSIVGIHDEDNYNNNGRNNDNLSNNNDIKNYITDNDNNNYKNNSNIKNIDYNNDSNLENIHNNYSNNNDNISNNITNNSKVASIDRNGLRTSGSQRFHTNIENIENRNLISSHIPIMDMSVHGEGRTSRNHVSTVFIFYLAFTIFFSTQSSFDLNLVVYMLCISIDIYRF